MSKLHPVRGEGVLDFKPVAADRRVERTRMTETRLDYENGDRTFVDGEVPQRFVAGDSFVIEPGFVGVWRVTAPMRKRFVVRAA